MKTWSTTTDRKGFIAILDHKKGGLVFLVVIFSIGGLLLGTPSSKEQQKEGSNMQSSVSGMFEAFTVPVPGGIKLQINRVNRRALIPVTFVEVFYDPPSSPVPSL